MKYLLPSLAGCLLLAGCHLDMVDQPKVESQAGYDFFSNDMGSRPPVDGTVEYLEPDQKTPFFTGYEDGKLVHEIPVPVTKELIERGQERYTIVCSHCHGAIGDGKGMIAQRGFELARPVASYHTERLREMPIGHFFEVITHGYGAMYPQGARVKPEDRWAIAAYIRVLQLSQYASAGNLSPELKDQLAPGQSTENSGGPLFQTEPAQTTPAPQKSTMPTNQQAGASGE